MKSSQVVCSPQLSNESNVCGCCSSGSMFIDATEEPAILRLLIVPPAPVGKYVESRPDLPPGRFYAQKTLERLCRSGRMCSVGVVSRQNRTYLAESQEVVMQGRHILHGHSARKMARDRNDFLAAVRAHTGASVNPGIGPGRKSPRTGEWTSPSPADAQQRSQNRATPAMRPGRPSSEESESTARECISPLAQHIESPQ